MNNSYKMHRVIDTTRSGTLNNRVDARFAIDAERDIIKSVRSDQPLASK